MRVLKYLLFAAVTLVVAGAVLSTAPGSRKDFTIRISGTPGLRVAGHYHADGKRRDFQGEVPTEVTATARNLEYSIRKASEPGDLKVELVMAGVSQMSASTGSARGGVSGRVRRRLLGGGQGTHTFTEAPRR